MNIKLWPKLNSIDFLMGANQWVQIYALFLPDG